MGSITVGCHAHGSPLDLKNSITKSCNAYYCFVYRSILDNTKYPSVQDAYVKWTQYLNSFGIGVLTGIDLPEESKGIVKKPSYFEREFGKNWRSSNVISMSIGQGQIGLTPLQMANMACIIGNRGFYYTPHVVRSIGDKHMVPAAFAQRHYCMVNKMYFDTVVAGMANVCVPGGTAGHTGIPGISICAKTGTAQNPHGKDHSIFIAFGSLSISRTSCPLLNNSRAIDRPTFPAPAIATRTSVLPVVLPESFQLQQDLSRSSSNGLDRLLG